MADIVILDMEMPKTCCQCDLKIYDPELLWDENGIEQIGAWVCKRTREIIWNTQRGENCPLVLLPEGHGRLIDADALMKKGMELDWSVQKWVQEVDIMTAKTIVPAEGGTDDGV